MTNDVQFITYQNDSKNFETFWKRIALVMFGSCVGWEDTADQDDN